MKDENTKILTGFILYSRSVRGNGYHTGVSFEQFEVPTDGPSAVTEEPPNDDSEPSVEQLTSRE